MVMITQDHANCGIYAIVFDNGKMYVGQAVNIRKRWWEHRYEAKTNDAMLYRAMRAHHHDFMILCNCPRENLGSLEAELIADLNTIKPNGYNLRGGDEFAPRSAETREKISALKRGIKTGPRPQEVKDKISAAQKGKKRRPLSAEHRAKLSAVKKGKPKHPGFGAILSAAKTGTSWTPRQRAAIEASIARRKSEQRVEIQYG